MRIAQNEQNRAQEYAVLFAGQNKTRLTVNEDASATAGGQGTRVTGVQRYANRLHGLQATNNKQGQRLTKRLTKRFKAQM
jgi:hypothetical protein